MSGRVVGIFVALSSEARAFTGQAQPVETPVKLAEGALLWVGGIGANAAVRGCLALVAAGADALASVGTAAGLSPGCVPGSLLLPERVVLPEGHTILTDSTWRQALEANLAPELSSVSGALAAADQVLDPAAKAALYRDTGAVAADMESAAVASEAVRQRLSLLVLRVVSDGPGDAVPTGVLSALDAFGRPNYLKLLTGLAKRPGEFGALRALFAGYRAACGVLSDAGRSAGPRLCCPP